MRRWPLSAAARNTRLVLAMYVLETARLVLRDFASSDLDTAHAYASDLDVTRYTSFGPNTRSETAVFLDSAIARARAKPRTDYALAIQLKESGFHIGGTGLHDPNHGQWEIGYVLARPYWGKGLATELVQALVDFGFEKLGAEKIWAPVDAANTASGRVLEKSGFTLEGILRKDRLKWAEGRDTKFYGLLRSEWKVPTHAA
jgi:[ribosomal protein S5]-alanine N-acetyltransferase